MVAICVPETSELEVHHNGNARGDSGVKQNLDGDAGARQGTVLWGLGRCRSLFCLSVPLPALPQAAILQQTAEYIFSLEQEKTRLLQQNTQLKRFIQVTPACAPQGWGGRGWDSPG